MLPKTLPVLLFLLVLGATLFCRPADAAVDAAESCAGGLVLDDGSAESGYGWVPSIERGIYVQRFDPPPSVVPGEVTEICVCWLRTRADDTLDFDLVLYRDAGDVPAATADAVVSVTASEVPEGLGGRFYSYAIPPGTMPLPGGPVYVGVRWSAMNDGFFFLCSDRSPETEVTELFFRDELSDDWTAAAETADPTFSMHRAALVRVGVRAATAVEIPTLSRASLIALGLLFAVIGVGRSIPPRP